jgi:hypothetical protein
MLRIQLFTLFEWICLIDGGASQLYMERRIIEASHRIFLNPVWWLLERY